MSSTMQYVVSIYSEDGAVTCYPVTHLEIGECLAAQIAYDHRESVDDVVARRRMLNHLLAGEFSEAIEVFHNHSGYMLEVIEVPRHPYRIGTELPKDIREQLPKDIAAIHEAAEAEETLEAAMLEADERGDGKIMGLGTPEDITPKSGDFPVESTTAQQPPQPIRLPE